MVDDFSSARHDKPSNWKQLQALGFAVPGATICQLLQADASESASAERYDAVLTDWLKAVDLSIGQFGIGEGYHTGGILPHSPAATENTKLVVSYEQDMLRRVTVTPKLISRLDVAFINSFGASKKSLVEHFLHSSATITAEPTQALKTAATTRLYTDAA